MNLKKLALVSFIIALLSLAGDQAIAREQHAEHGKRHGQEHGKEHGFGVTAFDKFHNILHPLQHEALPNKDYKTIRAKSTELVAAGRAIERLGTPKGVRQSRSYRAKLNKFSVALRRYRQDAAKGSDDQLHTSYVAVHDTFEELAHMLPRR